MLQQNQSRILRYSRPTSLSTISSNDESDFHNPDQLQSPATLSYHTESIHHRSTASHLTGLEPVARKTYHEQPSSFHSYIHEKQANGPIQMGFPFHSRGTEDSMVSRPETSDSTDSSIDNAKLANIEVRVKDEENNVVTGTYVKTEWMWMLLQSDEIPTWHNVIVAICAWIILAAYIVLPGTFTKLKSSEAVSSTSNGDNNPLDNVSQAIENGVDHLGLAVLSAVLASIGGLGSIAMWIVHRKNYLWLCTKIFMPIVLNSVAGLLTTVVNVYTAQKGAWSFTASVNATISGSVAGFTGLVYCFYYFMLLSDVKKDHVRHFKDAARIEELKRRAARERMRNRFN